MEEITLISLLELLALGTATFLGIHFLSLKEKSKQLLGYFLLLGFTMDFIYRAAFSLGVEISFDYLPQMSFIYIPFLYYYALQLTGQEMKGKWNLLIPSVVFYIAHLAAIYFDTEWYFVFEHLCTYLFSIYISILILQVIKKHQSNLLDYFSSIEYKGLKWLQKLTLILLLFNVLWMVEDAIYVFTDWEIFLAEVSAVATFVTVYWIGFSSLKQAVIFEEVVKSTEVELPGTLNQLETELYNKLISSMNEDALYKNENISLRELATQLNTSDKLLSKVINIETKNNFYHFINSYRIQNFKVAILNNRYPNLTQFGVAQECGFKTKSTFYSAFKKLHGCTPKEFVQSFKSE